MKYCKTCNRIQPAAPCADCTEEIVERSVPYRMRHPQIHERCHTCWNLLPVCRCNLGGSISLPEFPTLKA